MSVAFYTHDFGPLSENVSGVARGEHDTVLVVDVRMSRRGRRAAIAELLTVAEQIQLGGRRPTPA